MNKNWRREQKFWENLFPLPRVSAVAASVRVAVDDEAQVGLGLVFGNVCSAGSHGNVFIVAGHEGGHSRTDILLILKKI